MTSIAGDIELLKSFLDDSDIGYKENVSLRELSYFKTGGNISYLIRPSSINEFGELLVFLRGKEIKSRVIGGTSNILFEDKSDHLVLISTKKLQEFVYDESENILTVGSGVTLPALSRKTAKMALAGFEGIEGIPGTVGGAIYMNAEAFGCQISDYLLDVQVLEESGKVVSYSKEELDFSFRSSLFHKKKVGEILSARFQLLKDNKEDILERLNHFSTVRRNILEHALPNLGSIFATKDIYRDMIKHNPGYARVWNTVRFRILNNKFVIWLFKITNTAMNNNKLLNFATCWYFGLKFKKKPYSDKTMNTFINTNNISTDEIIEYINIIKRLTGDKVKVEIEIF